MQQPPTLKTSRLLLEPLCIGDAQAIQERFPHWEVVRYLNACVPWPYPDNGALSYLQDHALPAMALGKEWHWTIRLITEPEDVIGCISLMDQDNNNRGFWLSPPWQGQGLMGEACEVVDRYWFQTLQRDCMRVPKAAPNEASRRVSQRGGMTLISRSQAEFVSGSFTNEIWEINREQWLAQRG